MTAGRPPIGVFDSGIGGLTVVRALRQKIPTQEIIYFGDTARVPYGNKSPETVIRYAREAARLLLDYNISALIVACNTASAHSIPLLESELDIPVFGVIEPGVQRALQATQSNNILVVGTTGTIRSQAYQTRLRIEKPDLQILDQPCPLFVPLVEEGWLEGEITRAVIGAYLDRYKSKNIDTLVLGCTHYPLLKPALQAYWPEITLVDSGIETAAVVARHPLFSGSEKSTADSASCHYILSDEAANFRQIGQMFLGHEMADIEIKAPQDLFVH
jgi:glutamate racemase